MPRLAPVTRTVFPSIVIEFVLMKPPVVLAFESWLLGLDLEPGRVGECVICYAAARGSTSAGCGSAVCTRSRLRTSRNVIGTAAAPIAPHTQNAHWKPPVSAAGAAEPEGISVLKWVAATVEAIATPIAPPTCREAVSSPEARPAS